MDEKGSEIITGYDSVEAIENYDSSNTMWYESGVLKVKKDGKYGLVDLKGNKLAECEYSSIDALKGTTNSLITKKDEKYGLLDNTGATILSNEYKSIKPISDKYENGYIVQNESGKYGVMNWNKTVAVDTKYDDVKQLYSNGNYYVVKENGKWKIVDTVGGSYLAGEYDDITAIDGDYIVAKKSNKYGVVSILDSEVVVPLTYDLVVPASSKKYIVKTNGKYGVVDRENTKILEAKYLRLVYRSDASFYEGANSDNTSDLLDLTLNVKVTGIVSMINTKDGYIRVRVDDEYKYYNFKFEEKDSKEILKDNTIFLSKKNGKYGFIDKNGVVVVDYIYDDATEQNEFGYASVKKDGLWGCVDSKGNVKVTPAYSLENNASVEFIGKWHLGEDLNLNFYTDK